MPIAFKLYFFRKYESFTNWFFGVRKLVWYISVHMNLETPVMFFNRKFDLSITPPSSPPQKADQVPGDESGKKRVRVEEIARRHKSEEEIGGWKKMEKKQLIIFFAKGWSKWGLSLSSSQFLFFADRARLFYFLPEMKLSVSKMSMDAPKIWTTIIQKFSKWNPIARWCLHTFEIIESYEIWVDSL